MTFLWHLLDQGRRRVGHSRRRPPASSMTLLFSLNPFPLPHPPLPYPVSFPPRVQADRARPPSCWLLVHFRLKSTHFRHIPERRAYRALLRRKREAFWTSKVESERSSPRQLWRSIDAPIDRGRVPPSEVIGAAEFHRYFDEKVADVRALTDSAPPPSFFSAPSGCTFVNFRSDC